jgi:hypothetical protein
MDGIDGPRLGWMAVRHERGADTGSNGWKGTPLCIPPAQERQAMTTIRFG